MVGMIDTRGIIRHYLATLAFRLGRALDGAPESFGDFDIGSGVRTPLQIMRHIRGLMYFANQILTAEEMPEVAELLWPEEALRFTEAIEKVDKAMQESEPPSSERMLRALQGPLADAMTHIGQLATMRRMAGAPLEKIHYSEERIEIGDLTL